MVKKLHTTILTTIDFDDLKKDNSLLDKDKVECPLHQTVVSVQEQTVQRVPAFRRRFVCTPIHLSTFLIEGPYHTSLTTSTQFLYSENDRACSEIILSSPARIDERRKMKRKTTLSLIDLNQFPRTHPRSAINTTAAMRLRYKGGTHPKMSFLSTLMDLSTEAGTSSTSFHLCKSTRHQKICSQFHATSGTDFYSNFASQNQSQSLITNKKASKKLLQKLKRKIEREPKINPRPDLVISGCQFDSLQLSSVMTDLIDTALTQVGEMIEETESK